MGTLKNSAVAGGRVKIVPIRSSPQVSIAMGQYSFFDHENRLHSISKMALGRRGEEKVWH